MKEKFDSILTNLKKKEEFRVCLEPQKVRDNLKDVVGPLSKLKNLKSSLQVVEDKTRSKVPGLLSALRSRRNLSGIQIKISEEEKKLKNILSLAVKPVFEIAVKFFKEQVQQFQAPSPVKGADDAALEEEEEEESLLFRQTAVEALTDAVKSIVSLESESFLSSQTSPAKPAASMLQMALDELVSKIFKAAIYKFDVAALAKFTSENLENLIEDSVKSLYQTAFTASLSEKITKMAAGASQQLELVSKYESAITSACSQMSEEGKRSMQKILGGGKLRGIFFARVLTAGVNYSMGTGFMRSVRLLKAALSRPPMDLAKDEDQLLYLLDKLSKVSEMTITKDTWRDAVSTWVATLKLISQLNEERGVAVLQCIKADDKVLYALGAGMDLMKIEGDLPAAVLILLNEGPGNHIREHAYPYDKQLKKQISVIKSIKAYQAFLMWGAGSLMTSVFIYIANVGATATTDLMKAGGFSVWSMLAVVVAVVFGVSLCIFGVYICSRKMFNSSKVEKGAKYL